MQLEAVGKEQYVFIRVRNLNGTSDNKPPLGYTSLKEYWVRVKGYWPRYCAVYGCTDAPDVGAHVQKVDSYDKSWYIVPMCYLHNNQRGEILLVDESLLVRVNPRSY